MCEAKRQTVEVDKKNWKVLRLHAGAGQVLNQKTREG